MTSSAGDFDVPSGGGVGTARAIARRLCVFAKDGQELRLGPDTLQLLAAPAIPPAFGFCDKCLRGEVQFSLGFMKTSRNAVRAFGFVRCTRSGRISRLCRSGSRHRNANAPGLYGVPDVER
jgi:hypothetical protein